MAAELTPSTLSTIDRSAVSSDEAHVNVKSASGLHAPAQASLACTAIRRRLRESLSQSGDNMAMKVRSARVEDAVALAALHVRTWQSAYAGLIPQHVLDGLDIRQRRRAWRERIRASAMEGSAAGTLVAVTSTALVGFVHFGPTRDDGADPTIVGEIASLYVAPEQWGAGSGRRLLMTAVAALREVGFREATCWVLESNDRARRFYETNSWQLDGTAKDDESHGVTLREVRYWLPLT